MSAHSSNIMESAYELYRIQDEIIKNSRGVDRREKELFVQLADEAVKGDWGNKVLGGADVLEDIVNTRNLVQKRLAA